MEIIEFLKDVNHWGVLAVCVYGIIICISHLFKDSMNENIRITMTVTAVIFLAGIIVWLLFFNDGRSRRTTELSDEIRRDEQLVMMQNRLETALRSLDIASEKIRSQVSIHSEDVKRLSDVEIGAKTEQNKMFVALRNIQSRFDHYKESADKIIAGLQEQLDNEKARKSEVEEILSVQISIHSEDIRQIASAKAEYDRALRTLFFGNNENPQAYYTNALKLFREKAKESTEAQFLIGYILDPLHTNIKLSGKEKQNTDIAIREYETASKKGHKDVLFYLDNLLKQKNKK